ncbi:MAG: alpha-mannosidase [Clostridia bacterium]|nr:alpha-mannosidase [Clostridia bacterium]
MIGNTHFDPVWLWKWDEAMSSITATFRSALDRMKAYPDFKYSFSTPPVFEWIKKTSPDMFEEIRARVAEGRWELAEGWWLQPDCYAPSGESLVRQGLYGQRYLMENFGQYARSVFNIDSFGHSPMMPQILQKCRIPYYVFCRPERRHITLEQPLFRWRSPDGSCVLTYRDDGPYNPNTALAIEKAGALPYDTMLVYGVTDHGGAPTIRSIEEIRSSDRAVFSTVKEFFAEQDTDYTVDLELLSGDFGMYADQTEIKSLNRKAEYAILNAERASVIAERYDSEALRKCWQDVLFNQFHDILGGACIKQAYFDARNLYGRAIATADELMHYNLLRVTNQIEMPGKNPDNPWNIVVWNLNATEYRGYIEAEVQWMHEFPWYDGGIRLEDAERNTYECQIIRERSVVPRFRSRFLFKATVPPMGYRAFKVIKTEEAVVPQTQNDLYTLETERYTFTLAENGGIASVYDKREQRTVKSGLLSPACFVDDGDTWAFNIRGYGAELESFRPVSIELIEKGSHRTTVKATYAFRDSKLEMYYTVYDKESYLDVRYRVMWNEKHTVLKLMTDLEQSEHTASIPYGSVRRAESEAERPMGEWICADGLTFALDHAFAYTVLNRRLGITLLRSPIYGDLRIGEIDLTLDHEIHEQGINEGRVRVSFDEGCIAARMATAFNNPPIVLCESNHGGTLPSSGSYLSYEGEGIELTVLKQAEDTEETVVRGVECLGKQQTLRFTFKGRAYTLEVSPFEIFTVLIDGEDIKRVDMLEG